MRLFARLIASVMVVALASLCLWRILVTGMSDHLAAAGHPQQSLGWDRNNPAALATLAGEQRAHGNLDQAAESARALLQREPLDGKGFVILAELAEAAPDQAQATLMSSIAIRRAPYTLAPRAWLAGKQLGEGRYQEALENLDEILRISPARHTRLFPVLTELAAKAEFADALALKLATRPLWRASFLSSALTSASSEQLAAVFSALQRHGDLDAATIGLWIDRLVKDGQWGEAYARWVGGIQKGSLLRLSHVYNGGFETAPVGAGFDWRIGDSAGVLVDRPDRMGSDGSHAIRLTFLGRRVDAIPLHQWLMLGPGTYRLSFASAAQDLRSDRGVQWALRCLDDGAELAASEKLTGHFDWKQFELQFDVPGQACIAQDLSLRNAGADAAGKIIDGVIMFDDIAIDRVQGDSPSRH